MNLIHRTRNPRSCHVPLTIPLVLRTRPQFRPSARKTPRRFGRPSASTLNCLLLDWRSPTVPLHLGPARLLQHSLPYHQLFSATAPKHRTHPPYFIGLNDSLRKWVQWPPLRASTLPRNQRATSPPLRLLASGTRLAGPPCRHLSSVMAVHPHTNNRRPSYLSLPPRTHCFQATLTSRLYRVTFHSPALTPSSLPPIRLYLLILLALHSLHRPNRLLWFTYTPGRPTQSRRTRIGHVPPTADDLHHVGGGRHQHLAVRYF